MRNIEYHLIELEIAKNPEDERWALPRLIDTDRAVLDIGCGVGQSLIALGCTDRRGTGLDVDEEAIKYGIEHFGKDIQFILADAKRVPLPAGIFDLVYCRAALAYMNIPRALVEMQRLLRGRGRLWATLHTKEMALEALRDGIRRRSPRRVSHAIYVLVNGFLLKYLGFVVPYITGRMESWQSPVSLARKLERRGFDVQVYELRRRVVLEARLK